MRRLALFVALVLIASLLPTFGGVERAAADDIPQLRAIPWDGCESPCSYLSGINGWENEVDKYRFKVEASDTEGPVDVTWSGDIQPDMVFGGGAEPGINGFTTLEWDPDETTGSDQVDCFFPNGNTAVGQCYWITITATDSLGQAVSVDVYLRVIEDDQPLVISGIPAATNLEVGETLSFTASAFDPDIPQSGTSYEWTLEADGPFGEPPAGASIGLTTGFFSWTPTADQVGQHLLFIGTHNEGGEFGGEELLVTVGGDGAIDVCPIGCTFGLIQPAIDAAAPGDEITVGPGTYVENLTIGKDLSIVGSGIDATVVDGSFLDTTVRVGVGSAVMLSDLRVTGGLALYEDGVTSGNGGGIENLGDLTISQVAVNGNIAGTNARSAGGGIYSAGPLAVVDSVIVSNEAENGGGGIYLAGATFSITDSTIQNNRVYDDTTDGRGGGGLHVINGTGTVLRASIDGNATDFQGGGVMIRGSGSDVAIVDSTITDNVSRFGSGINTYQSATTHIEGSTIAGNRNPPGGLSSGGGGIRARAATTIVNSTISGNTTTGVGGGVYSESAVTVDSATIYGNQAQWGGGVGSYSAGFTTIDNSVLYANTATTAGNDCAGSLDGGGNDLIGDTTDCDVTAVTGLVAGVDPLLGPLADNGGATPTHLPDVGSPLLDAGGTDLTDDQRNQPRPSGDADDIGAVEVQDAVPEIVTITIGEGIGIGDAVEVQPPVQILISEGIGVGDEVGLDPPVVIAISEGIGVGDGVTVRPPVEIVISEGVGVRDDVVVRPPVEIVISEGVGVRDDVAVNPPVEIMISEGVGVADDVTVQLPIEITITEGVGVADAVTVATVEEGTVSSGTLLPGGSYAFSGSGFDPGSGINIGLESEFIPLTTTVADENGDFSVTVTLPPAEELPEGFAGEHTLVAKGINPHGFPHEVRTGVIVAAPIEITLNPNNPTAATTDFAGPITLTAEVAYDGSGLTGDSPDLADFSIRLEPVGPGNVVAATTCAPSSGPVGGSSTVSCDFAVADLGVNVYTVVAEHSGGDFYGRDEAVFTMADPSLGFVTGGGQLDWPDSNDHTNFGLALQYNKKGTNVRGTFLLIRHLADGSKYRIKSNALDGLALGSPENWASFTGKATYLAPDMTEPEGNHTFVAYVVDDPAGDRIWIELRNKDGDIVQELSMPAPADGNAVTIDGGNIIVPQDGSHGGPRRR